MVAEYLAFSLALILVSLYLIKWVLMIAESKTLYREDSILRASKGKIPISYSEYINRNKYYTENKGKPNE